MTGASTRCDLCGLDAGDVAFPRRTLEGELRFCCAACRGIWELLHAGDERAGATGAPGPTRGRGDEHAVSPVGEGT